MQPVRLKKHQSKTKENLLYHQSLPQSIFLTPPRMTPSHLTSSLLQTQPPYQATQRPRHTDRQITTKNIHSSIHLSVKRHIPLTQEPQTGPNRLRLIRRKHHQTSLSTSLYFKHAKNKSSSHRGECLKAAVAAVPRMSFTVPSMLLYDDDEAT